MVPWPERVNIPTEGLATLEKIFKTALAELFAEINGATNFGVANRKVILAQIGKRLQELGVDVNDFIEKEIPNAYKTGADDAVSQLEDLGAEAPVKYGFNRVNNEAINALVSDTASSFADAIQGVNRSATRLLSSGVKQQLTQDIAKGIAKGETLDQVKKTIKGTLADEGLDSLVDKAGRKWSLDRYSDMLFRTKVAEARNLGMVNRMAENGYDLVQVSAHGAIDVCGKWEGRILSSTGATKEYDGESVPTVDDATRDGLFHPNCRHAINAIIPDLAAEAYAYNKDTGTYEKGGLNKIAKDAAVQAKEEAATTVTSMLEKATEYNPVFTNKLTNIASNNDFSIKPGQVKNADRALEKVIHDYASTPSLLKDANRGVLLVDDPTNIDSILIEVKKEFTVVRVKNDFDTTTSGYKKILINVKTPAGIGEIQVTTPEYWQAKKELGGDELYNAVRVNEADWEKAMEKMNQLYEDAGNALARRLNSS